MRILVVRLSSLGDVVHAIPAVAALRRRFPDARIDWLVDDRFCELVELVGGVDHVFGLPRGRTLSWAARIVPHLRATRYDVAIDLQGLIRSGVLSWISGAPRILGFASDQLRERPARWFYTDQPAAYLYRHVIDKNLALVARLGVATEPWEFPIREPSTDVVTRALGTAAPGPTPRFGLLNPGAAWPSKRWPPGQFGMLAARLKDEHALTSVVTWGPGERQLAEQVAEASKGAAVVAPPTSVIDLVALARSAAIMVSGDTGPLHLAAAVGTPVVGVFGPSDPGRNGPWSPGDLVVSRFDDCQCHRTREGAEGVVVRDCLAAKGCISDITVSEVADAVARRVKLLPTS